MMAMSVLAYEGRCSDDSCRVLLKKIAAASGGCHRNITGAGVESGQGTDALTRLRRF